jgi:hypothetical protein
MSYKFCPPQLYGIKSFCPARQINKIYKANDGFKIFFTFETTIIKTKLHEQNFPAQKSTSQKNKVNPSKKQLRN